MACRNDQREQPIAGQTFSITAPQRPELTFRSAPRGQAEHVKFTALGTHRQIGAAIFRRSIRRDRRVLLSISTFSSPLTHEPGGSPASCQWERWRGEREQTILLRQFRGLRVVFRARSARRSGAGLTSSLRENPAANDWGLFWDAPIERRHGLETIQSALYSCICDRMTRHPERSRGPRVESHDCHRPSTSLASLR